jgi:O-antigen ligase
MILTGVLYHRRKLFLNLNLNKILKILIVFGILIQILYSIFVYQILSGNIVNERTKKQLNAIENPYNIANLLVNGRAETFVAIEAVKDKPFFGHGSWAPDPTGKYNYMISILQNDKEAFDREFVPEKGFIPSHSILLGAWMTSGLLGFLSVGYIVIIFLKASLNILKKPSSYVLPFLPIVIFFMINGFWTFLFSPLAHLRQTIPIMLAFVIVLNQKNYYKSQI